MLAARIKQENLMNKTDFDTKLTGFNKRVNSSKRKQLVTENELKRLKKIDLSYFRGNLFWTTMVFSKYVCLSTNS